MKISVIIPTYNPKNYLWECLESLKYQTFPPCDFEILIVLNGAKNPYYRNIEHYIIDNLMGINVYLFYSNIEGVSNARNIGLENAKGEFITFIDDDDYVSQSFLYDLYQVADKDTIALSNVISFIDGDSNMIPVPYKKSDLFRILCSKGNIKYLKARQYFSGSCMKLISSDIINNRRFNIKFKNGEDSLFMFLISDKIKMVCAANIDAIYFRRNRLDSAYNSRKKVIYKIRNSVLILLEYNKIYFSNLRKYSFIFYLTRVLGLLKTMLS